MFFLPLISLILFLNCVVLLKPFLHLLLYFLIPWSPSLGFLSERGEGWLKTLLGTSKESSAAISLLPPFIIFISYVLCSKLLVALTVPFIAALPLQLVLGRDLAYLPLLLSRLRTCTLCFWVPVIPCV